MQSASVRFDNITATTAGFYWGGGRTVIAAAGNFTGGLEVTLQRLGPDGLTWIDIGAAKTASSQANVELCPGTYRWEFAVGTSTGMFLELCRVPV
jgi:hypothetical protein